MALRKWFKKWFKSLLATVLAVIAMSIFARMIWDAWDWFIFCLVIRGIPAYVEYILGFVVFLIAVWLGAIQLKKMKKKVF